jgi:ribose transport system ATP-binding protein
MSAIGHDAGRIVLEARGISKSFGGVKALDGVDFALAAGEIHGLIGQNGAGKSTLVKVLNGVHRPDAGSIAVDGREVVYETPQDARRHGTAMVFQEFSLVPTLSVAQNVFLTHEPRVLGALIDDRATRQRTAALLADLGVELDADTPVGRLPVGSQQLVEIAKAMAWSPSILILDEPTASLSQSEVAILFDVLHRLRGRGVAIIYISHHLGEVMAICDRITVLRDGAVGLAGRPADIGLPGIVAAVSGRSLAGLQHPHVPSAERAAKAPILELEGWTLGRRVVDVTLAVRPGEVLGIAGLLGSGRTSLLRSVMGLEPGVRGELRIDGRAARVKDPADAIAKGIVYVPEDRRREGIIAGQTVASNLLVSIWSRLTRLFLIREAEATRVAREMIERLQIRTSGGGQLIETLSGGNQQKVVVGRSLGVAPRVLLLDDPTAGIDIGSRRELLEHVRRFADDGHGVVLVSSELEELGLVADRIAILHAGRVARVLERDLGDDVSDAALLTAIQHAGEAA